MSAEGAARALAIHLIGVLQTRAATVNYSKVDMLYVRRGQGSLKMPDTEKRCRLVEILQYECTPGEAGSPVTCFPLPRIFRMCATLRHLLKPWIRSEDE